MGVGFRVLHRVHDRVFRNLSVRAGFLAQQVSSQHVIVMLYAAVILHLRIDGRMSGDAYYGRAVDDRDDESGATAWSSGMHGSPAGGHGANPRLRASVE